MSKKTQMREASQAQPQLQFGKRENVVFLGGFRALQEKEFASEFESADVFSDKG